MPAFYLLGAIAVVGIWFSCADQFEEIGKAIIHWLQDVFDDSDDDYYI